MWKLSTVAALAGALALPLAGCGGAKQATQVVSLPQVQTTVASYGTVRPGSTLAGIIAPYQSVAIQSSLNEPALSVNVQEGDRVYKGEVLAQLDTADLQAALQSALATAAGDRATTAHSVYQGNLNIAQGVDQVRIARSAVLQAQANLARDSTTLARYRQLLAQGFIAAQTVLQQQTTVQNDGQILRSARASLSSTQSAVQANGTSLSSSGLQASTVAQSAATVQVALAQAHQQRVQIAKATITSPIDGVVVNRNLNPGEYPGARQLFTLQQVDPIYAVLRGSSGQVARVVSGAAATVVTSDARHSRYVGKVIGVLNEIAPGSTDFQVKVLIPNPAQRLRPGAVVVGTIANPAVNGIRVPITSFTDDTHTSLLVVDSSNTVNTAHVTELGSDGTTAVVAGLQPGTRIVTNGQTSVANGEKVAVR